MCNCNQKRNLVIGILAVLLIVVVIRIYNRPVYKMVKVEYANNIFVPNWKMVTARIKLPIDISHKKITKNFEKLIIDIYKTKQKPHKIRIFAYGPKDNVDGIPTIAQCELITDTFKGEKSYFKKNKLNIEFKK